MQGWYKYSTISPTSLMLARTLLRNQSNQFSQIHTGVSKDDWNTCAHTSSLVGNLPKLIPRVKITPGYPVIVQHYHVYKELRCNYLPVYTIYTIQICAHIISMSFLKLILYQFTGFPRSSLYNHFFKIPFGIVLCALRYADNTTLMAESEEELKNLLMRVKEDSQTAGLKLNIKKKLRSRPTAPLLHGK